MSEEELEFEFRESAGFVDLEEGTYEAKLDRVELITTEYGKSLRWIFDVYVDEDDVEAVEVSGMSSIKFTDKSKAYKWFSALGGKVKDGKIRLDDIIGNECLVEIKHRKGKDGETVFPNVVDVKPPLRRRKRGIEEPEEEEYDFSKKEEEEEEEEKEERKEKKTKKSKKSKRKEEDEEE